MVSVNIGSRTSLLARRRALREQCYSLPASLHAVAVRDSIPAWVACEPPSLVRERRWKSSTSASPKHPVPARCSWLRRRWASAAPTSTTSSVTSARSTTRRRSIPRIQGHEAAAVIVELGAELAVGPRAGHARRHLARQLLRSLLPVPHRSRKRVCADLADGDSRGRGAAGAARPGFVARLPRGRPGSRPDGARRAGLDRGSGRGARSRRAGRARGDPRRRPDRSGPGTRGYRPRGVGPARRQDREPPGPRGRRRCRHASTSHRRATSSAAVREWSGGDGPEVVFEATGVPDLVQTAVELVAPAGRVVVVGLSSEHAPVRVGDLPFRELDLIGTSCCGAGRLRRSRRSRQAAARCGVRSGHARVHPRAGSRGDRLCDRASRGGDEGGRPARRDLASTLSPRRPVPSRRRSRSPAR